MTALLFAALVTQAWPVLEVDTLAGGKAKLPPGGIALVVMSFSKDAGMASKAWADRFTRDGGAAYTAAVLEAAPRLVRGLIRSGMRGDVPKAMHERTLLIYRDEAGWKKRVAFVAGTEKQPYLVLLDKEGRPQWMHHGGFEEKAYAEMRQRASQIK